MTEPEEHRQQFWTDLKSGQFAGMVRDSARGQTVANSKELYHILKPLYAQEPDIEKAYFIFLDAKNKVLSIDCMFTGTLTASAIYPREVMKRILSTHAAAFIVAHNHPSGDPTPSADDRRITLQLLVMAHGVSVTMHEHIIVGGGYYSMADDGLIQALKSKCLEAFKA